LRIGLAFALVALGLGVTLFACPAAHDPFPDQTCKTTADCYGNETCVMNVCTPPPDLARGPDMALIIFDFSMPDGGGDL
jgi:hypothetical protein